MNPRSLLAAACTLVLTSVTATAQTASAPNEGTRLTLDPASGAYTLAWWGHAGRSYFLQQSEDLINWVYVPIIEPGQDQVVGWSFTANSSKAFLRLKSSSLAANEDPFTRDSDGDGVSDYDELLAGTDPFSSVDANGNGLPDDWEAAHPGSSNPTADPELDGLTNAQELAQHTDPAKKDNPAVKLLVSVISQ